MMKSDVFDRNGTEICNGDFITDGHFMWQVYFKQGAFRCKLVSHCNDNIDDKLLSQVVNARKRAKMPVEVNKPSEEAI